jgi:hypothetical protein
MKDLFCRLLKAYITDALKLSATSYYVRAIAEARRIFIEALFVKVGLLLMFIGFVLMHLAIFVFMPWEPCTKAIILLCLGALYVIVPGIYVLKVCSQKFWMTRSGASKLVENAIGRK